MTRNDRIAMCALAGAFLATQFEAFSLFRKNRELMEERDMILKGFSDLAKKNDKDVDDYNRLVDRTTYVINKMGAKLSELGVEEDDVFDQFDLIALQGIMGPDAVKK